MMVAFAGLLACAAPVRGQTKPPDDGLPEIADVIAAHRAVRGWVSTFEIPLPEEASARLAIRGAQGACVILRSEGRVVGLGTAIMGGELDVRRAAARAMGDVLSDAAVAGLPEGLRGAMGPQLCVEVEAAGAMIPTVAGSFAEFAARLEPGLDGLAIRRGRQWAARFPAQLRATNSAGRAETLMPGLALELGLTAAGFRKLLEDGALAFYLFRTIDLAQAAPDAAPLATHRGDTIVEDSSVTKRSIQQFADALALHVLGTRLGGEDGAAPFPAAPDAPLLRGLAGAYQPVADRYDPPVAPPAEQALGALALARHAAAPGVDGSIAREAIDAAAELLRELERPAPSVADHQPGADELVAAAVTILAADALPPSRVDARIAALSDAAAAMLARLPEAIEPAHAEAARLTAPARAVIAAAWSRRLLRAPATVEAARVRAAIDAAWEAAAETERVALLPWIGWAEIDWADATGGPIARAGELEALRALLWASQIRSGEREPARDLLGGFALRSEGITWAGAASTKPGAWLAAAMRDPRLTPPDAAMPEAARCLRAVRFLMQLSVREELLWSCRRPERAIGGLRSALWDNEQAPAAQAMGLLAAAELLTSLETLESRDKR